MLKVLYSIFVHASNMWFSHKYLVRFRNRLLTCSHWTGTRLLGEGPEQVRCLDALTFESVAHQEDAKGFVCIRMRCQGKWQNVQIYTAFCLSFGWSLFWVKQNFCNQQAPKGCCQIISPSTCSCAAPHELTPPSKCSCYSSDSCMFKNSFPGLRVPQASLSLFCKCPAASSVFHGCSRLSLSPCMIVFLCRGIRSDVAVYR